MEISQNIKNEYSIQSHELIFQDANGNFKGKFIIEDNFKTKTGTVQLEISCYEGQAKYYNLDCSLLEFLKTENPKYLIFKAFNVERIEKISTGVQLLMWVKENGLSELKEARKKNVIDEFDLRCMYDELEYLNSGKEPFYHSISNDFHNGFIKIYGEDYYNLDFSIKSKEYEFLYERILKIQEQLKKI